jgi:L-ectoine synthase
MIVRTLDEILKSDRNVEASSWASRRFLLEKDDMGFSLSETTVYEGTETHIWYRHHLEACYCIEGEGEVEVLAPEPRIYPIGPGTMYALDKHDKHILRAKTRMRLICVFNPPLTGREVHDADGAYAPADKRRTT